MNRSKRLGLASIFLIFGAVHVYYSLGIGTTYRLCSCGNFVRVGIFSCATR